MHPDDFAYPWCSLRTDVLLAPPPARDARRRGRGHAAEASTCSLAALLLVLGTLGVAQEHMNFNVHRRGLAPDLEPP